MSTSGSESVNYETLDPFKVEAQRAASLTDGNIVRLGLEVVRSSRGESVFIVKDNSGTSIPVVGGVIETLGTKSLVADAVGSQARTYYDRLAKDTVAMIVNDAAAMGHIPIVVGQLLLLGSDDWFQGERSRDLVRGWKDACDEARCVYGPGETATLKGVVAPETAAISGFATSIEFPGDNSINGSVQAGDCVVLLGSTGIHANGLTNARALAARLPAGYETHLPSGATYGQALLEPTHIYSQVVEDVLAAGVEVHYAVHITGHGWRKLMRGHGDFEYIIDELPEVPEVLDFIVSNSSMDAAEAYATFNMGAGYALYISSRDDFEEVARIASRSNIHASRGGFVRSSSSGKRVVLSQLDVTYEESSLQVR
jgi:phosphoribosylformylglycinamidine cyclo-ligase